jgi:DMSO/TMAO reductase YedYZ molybdopterin-dependent catalytic subunit
LVKIKHVFIALVAVIFMIASVFLFVFRKETSPRTVLSYDEVLEQPAVSAVYHSINNWQTVEDTWFEGVVLYSMLEGQGIEDEGAQVKLIASDEYFWPAVGTVLTLGDLKRPNQAGVYPLLAYEMNGEMLQPEPDGSGPLRLVMPQYAEDEINKPSWVSNVRLIEIGPLDGESEALDPSEVPTDEIWLYGNIGAVYRYSLALPLSLLVFGIILLVGALILAIGGRGKGEKGPGTAVVVLIASLLACSGCLAAIGGSTHCLADPGSRVFSMSELKSMPSFSGHYTFLKSQEPYTYYEDDYKGVPLSYLIEEKMNLLPSATEVVIRARDNYSKTLSLSQVRATYPGGLKVIIAYERNGEPLSGDESGLRLVVPQTVQGDKDHGGDANTPLCVRMVYAVEVAPIPAGEQQPYAGSVSTGSLAVYGSVIEPVPAPPDPEPVTPQPSPQPTAGDQNLPATVSPGDEASPAVAGTFLQDPLGAFSVHWMVLATAGFQPLKAMLPLVFYLSRDGVTP